MTPRALKALYYGLLRLPMYVNGAVCKALRCPTGTTLFVERDTTWFSDFPDPHSSIGGKFKNFVFCRGEHLTALDESYMPELLEASGFRDTRFLTPTKVTGLSDLGIDQTVLSREYESDFATPTRSLSKRGNRSRQCS